MKVLLSEQVQVGWELEEPQNMLNRPPTILASISAPSCGSPEVSERQRQRRTGDFILMLERPDSGEVRGGVAYIAAKISAEEATSVGLYP